MGGSGVQSRESAAIRLRSRMLAQARQGWQFVGTYSTLELLACRNRSCSSWRLGIPCHSASDHTQRCVISDVFDTQHNGGNTFRLGTFRTLSGYFLTYFFLPLREWRAQISLTWSLKRGGTALDPCVSPLTNSTTFSSSSFSLHAWKASKFSKTKV